MNFAQIVESLNGLSREDLVKLAEILRDQHDVYIYKGPGDGDWEEASQPVSVVLVDVGPNLIYTIKILRDLFHTGLKETKEVADSVRQGHPQVILADVGGDQARDVAAQLEAVGARVEVRRWV